MYELLNEKKSLNEIQNYIKEVIEIRGFSEQKVQDKMLLLLEETGELAKAIRKTIPEASVDYERIENYTDSLEELTMLTDAVYIASLHETHYEYAKYMLNNKEIDISGFIA